MNYPLEDKPFILALMLLVVFAAGIDYKIQKLPNILTFPAMMFALFYHYIFNGWEGFLFGLKGMGAGIALLILPWLMGGMGAGDAKLLGAVGAFIGAKATVVAFLYIAVSGLIYVLILVFLQKEQFKEYFKQLAVTVSLFYATKKYIPIPQTEGQNRPRVYYGIPIALGTICYVILELTGHQLIS